MTSRNPPANAGRNSPMTYGSMTRQRPSAATASSSANPIKRPISVQQTRDIATETITARPDRPNYPSQSSGIKPRNSSPSKIAPKLGARVGSDDTAKKRKHSSAFAGVAESRSVHQTGGQLGESKTSESTQRSNDAQPPADTASKNTKAGLLPPIALQPGSFRGHPRQIAEAHNQLDTTVSQPPRRRLIDTLAAQKAVSDSDSESPSSPDSASGEDSAARSVTGSAHASPSPHLRRALVRTPDRRPLLSKSRKIKLTYSQSRSFLGSASQSASDTALYDNIAKGISPTPEDVVFPAKTSPLPADYDFEDEPSSERLGIQSVHELRRAGANHRFSDEMDDLLSRIGNPTAAPTVMRRNALCELANKLQRKDFANQFRDHAARDKVVKDIGAEEDVISGFALAASLVIFLSSSPAPHLLRQMATDRVGRLICRLLQYQEDVDTLMGHKHLNLARNTKGSLKGVKEQLLQMAIWQNQRLSTLTPRTLALQLYYILSRDADPGCLDEVSVDVHKVLAAIALTYSVHNTQADIDYTLIVVALESQSNLMASGGNQYAPAVAQFLRRTLDGWPTQRSSLDKATLKLAINTGNTESGATIFDETGLLSSLTASISSGFTVLRAAVEQKTFEDELYDELLLILGIMINILEHCPTARASLDGNSLDTLTSLWVNSSSIVSNVSGYYEGAAIVKLTTRKAESVGQSKLGVALGYVAITVGYLYLAPSGRIQMRDHENWPGTEHLINSIQEFLGICKTIGNKMQELDILVNDLRKQLKAER